MRVIITLILLLTGCSTYYPMGSYSPGPPATIWVNSGFSVGKQCVKSDWEPEHIHKQANVKARLVREGIHIYEKDVVKGASCRSCRCAAYTALFYAQIDAGKEDQATAAGFELSEPPPQNY